MGCVRGRGSRIHGHAPKRSHHARAHWCEFASEDRFDFDRQRQDQDFHNHILICYLYNFKVYICSESE